MTQQLVPVNLVISSGEPAGVGPEVSIAAAMAFLQEQPASTITLLGDYSLFTATDIPRDLSNRLQIESIALTSPVVVGQLNPANAQYVLNILDVAVKGCLGGRFDAMVTAPIQKSVINQGITSGDSLFTGHTEYLAKLCDQAHVVMMLCATLPVGFLGLQTSRDLRVALVTTHHPLKEVANELSQEHILETIQIVNQDLRKKFAIANPVIRVAGLNPHAGESGYLGREEIDMIALKLKQGGITKTVTFDGRTTMNKRSEILKGDNEVLILQIQTGCEGLNLQDKYSEIYFVSPHWNPAIEEQAIARCHRIGQTKPVYVERFEMCNFPEEEGEDKIVSRSVDNYVCAIQDFKRVIVSEII